MRHTSKRYWLVLLVVLSATAWHYFGGAGVSFPVAQGAVPEHITLTWQEDPRTTQTITWRAGTGNEAGRVEYGEGDALGRLPGKPMFARAEAERLATNLGEVNIYSVTLRGLKQGTRYAYRVGTDAGWSEPSSFSTADEPGKGGKFLVFGDSQSVHYDAWRRTLHNAVQANPGAAFFINVGDLVDVGQDYRQWEGWFKAAAGVVDRIPAMPVTGNHEYYTPERRFSMPVLFTAQFKLPHNGPAALRGQAYSFDYGDVHFVMLDTQAGEAAAFASGTLELQRDWLERDLARTDKRWKVAVMHRSPYDNRSGNERVRATLAPVLERNLVDVVFTGHDHVYARTFSIQNGAIMAEGAKGTIYVAAGRSGTKTYGDPQANRWNEFFYNPLEEANYIVVTMHGDSLAIQVFKQSGDLVDSWRIEKAAIGPTMKKPLAVSARGFVRVS